MSDSCKFQDGASSLAPAGSAACCHGCGSDAVYGLVLAFWVPIEGEGNPERPLHELVESETEIGLERMCRRCGLEWVAGKETPFVESPNAVVSDGGSPFAPRPGSEGNHETQRTTDP